MLVLKCLHKNLLFLLLLFVVEIINSVNRTPCDRIRISTYISQGSIELRGHCFRLHFVVEKKKKKQNTATKQNSIQHYLQTHANWLLPNYIQ